MFSTTSLSQLILFALFLFSQEQPLRFDLFVQLPSSHFGSLRLAGEAYRPGWRWHHAWPGRFLHDTSPAFRVRRWIYLS